MKHLNEGLIKQRGSVKLTPKQLLRDFDVVETVGEVDYVYFRHPDKHFNNDFINISESGPVFVHSIFGDVNWVTLSMYDDVLNFKYRNPVYFIKKIYRFHKIPEFKTVMDIGSDHLKSLVESEKPDLIWER